MGEHGQLSTEQTEILLRPIKAERVSKTQGMSYLESHDVIAHLIRVFGFGGWDSEVTSGPDLVFEHDRGGDKWDVVYKATVRLTVYAPDGLVVSVKEDSATGDAQNQRRSEAHDLALKSAVSTAQKRAARMLGDQFGLSLYDKGSLAGAVGTIVGGPSLRDLESPQEPSEAPTGTGGPDLLSEAQRKAIYAASRAHNLDPNEAASRILGMQVRHVTMLSAEQAQKVLSELNKETQG
jgi:hypothetical protein